MSLSSRQVADLVREQIPTISDSRVRARAEELLVVPHAVEAEWDYSKERQKFTCWIFLEHRDSDTGIAYCGEGFGPSCPWGLMSLTEPYRIGMDCQWYPTLESGVA